MSFKFQLQPKAEKDLEKIWHYSADKWDIIQANKYIDNLVNTFQLIAENPQISREYTEFKPCVRIHPHRKHLVIYIIKEQQILIVRILHSSMDIDSHLD